MHFVAGFCLAIVFQTAHIMPDCKHDSFSENSISNFYLPYSLSPNFLINNKNYTIPLVTEESSVVAALSNAAKFWFDKGGFKSKVTSFTFKKCF